MTNEENNKLAPRGAKVTLPSLHKKLNEANSNVARIDPATMANRLVLILDDSGSMNGISGDKSKIDHLRDAIQGFLAQCDFSNTAVAITTMNKSLTTPLDRQGSLLQMQASGIHAIGSTPMAEAMEAALMSYSMTRAILVSDGGYTGANPIEQARAYANAEIACDCVHIGDDTSGERILQDIAEITHGIFIKFTDVASFGRNFKYLTPGLYGMLTTGTVTAAQLGAKEVK